MIRGGNLRQFLFVCGVTLFTAFSAFADPMAATSEKQSCLFLSTPEKALQTALHEHAMYSELNTGIVQRAFRAAMTGLDPTGVFFSKADQQRLLELSPAKLEALAQDVIQNRDYSHFGEILSVAATNIQVAFEFLKTVPNKRAVVIERSKPEYQAKANTYSFNQPVENQSQMQERLLDFVAGLYLKHKFYGSHDREAYVLAVRDASRVMQNLARSVSRPLPEVAVRSLMQGLDPRSRYMHEVEWYTFMMAMQGNYVGLGFSIRERWNGYEVDPSESSPAFEAGLRKGDILTHIFYEDQPVKFKEFIDGTEVTFALKGPEGSSIKLRLLRDNKPYDVTVIRKSIPATSRANNIEHLLKKTQDGPDLGYLRLGSFYNKSEEDVRSAILSLKEQGMKGLILDLRANSGGNSESTRQILSYFIDSGTAYMELSMRGNQRLLQPAPIPPQQKIWDGPLIVLINEYSASASELVAMAIADHRRGIIAGGPRSFGKGSVQRATSLYDEDGKVTAGMTVTVALFMGPEGNSPNLRGVTSQIPFRMDALAIGESIANPHTTIPVIKIDSSIASDPGRDATYLSIIERLKAKNAERHPDPISLETANPWSTELERAYEVLQDYIEELHRQP